MESDEIRRLRAEIDDLTRRMPAHSMPPSMLERLEELEAELEAAEARASTPGGSSDDGHDRR